MALRNERLRTKRLQVKMTEDEFELVLKLAARDGYAYISDWVRWKLLQSRKRRD